MSAQRTLATLSANASPAEGGQGLNLCQMAEALRDPFDLTVFCRSGQVDLNARVLRDSPAAAAIRWTPVLRRLAGLQTRLSNAHFDRSVARQMPPADLFQGTTGQCLESLTLAKSRGAFTIVDCITTHIDDFIAQQEREYGFFGMKAESTQRSRDVAVAEYNVADRIRVMSEYARNTFLKEGVPDQKIFVAKPPLAMDGFPIANFQSPRFRVSFVGLLSPTKGFHYLVQAFRNLPLPDAELVLWTAPGHRPVAKYMREQMAHDSRISMWPISVRRNFGLVYGGSHVLVHPSLADGYAYAVMEAMASGLGVIVTNATGSAQLIRDGENGFIVPVRDPDAIRDRLMFLAQNPDRLRKMGAAARETIKRETPQLFRDFYSNKLRSFLTEREPCRT